MTGSRAFKTLEAMRANPRDWRIADLGAVGGCIRDQCAQAGRNHIYFTYSAVAKGVSVPAHRPIKPVYVGAFVRLVDRVRQG